MQKKMFEKHGLVITGTDNQNELYASDEKQFDYVKDSLERIYSSVTNNVAKTNDKFLSTSRLGSGLFLIAVGDFDRNSKREPKLMLYKPSKHEFITETSIEQLEILKNKKFVNDVAMNMSKSRNDIMNEDVMSEAFKIYHNVEDTDNIEYRPQPLDNSKQSLKSERGFYIGDPSVVLKDDILNNGVRKGSVMQTGVYHVKDNMMVIAHATNGSHNGYEVYSGTIGVVPLELVDTDKIKKLPSDSFGVKLGNNINLIAKKDKIYLAQDKIEEIDTQIADTVYNDNSDQYNM